MAAIHTGGGGSAAEILSQRQKGEPRPAPTLCRWYRDCWVCGVKGMTVGRLQLDQNYKPGCPISLLESPCLPGLPA